MPDDATKPKKLRYPRNPDLDPQLVWRGKDAEDAKRPRGRGAADLRPGEDPPAGDHRGLEARTAQRRGEAAPQVDLFPDFNGLPDKEDKLDFYQHEQNWSNRMILGDSLLVMTSLAEREGLRGQGPVIYLDPPYGINFNSNWQPSTRNRDVKDGKEDTSPASRR